MYRLLEIDSFSYIFSMEREGKLSLERRGNGYNPTRFTRSLNRGSERRPSMFGSTFK